MFHNRQQSEWCHHSQAPNDIAVKAMLLFLLIPTIQQLQKGLIHCLPVFRRNSARNTGKHQHEDSFVTCTTKTACVIR